MRLLRNLAAGLLLLVSACASAPPTAMQTGPAGAPALMNALVGHWAMAGVIAGQNVVHDVDAQWVLQGKYVRVDEVSHEKDSQGRAVYEATIYVGWLADEQRYVCLWLDNTGVANGKISCYAPASEDALGFEFRDESGALVIATTFTHHESDDSWDWRIENVENGVRSDFAALILHRRAE